LLALEFRIQKITEALTPDFIIKNIIMSKQAIKVGKVFYYYMFLAPLIGLLSLLFIVNILSISIAQETIAPAAEPFWTKGAPMPTPRTEVAATILGDNVYVIGGFDKSSQVTNVVEVYNINNNSWTKADPLPQPLHHTAAASYNGKIYVIGGYTAPWSATDKLFIYDL
jgi:N-acetylneuraminic acid mutarotase